MSNDQPVPRRQLVGRRVGLATYYQIAERSATRLVLTSAPRANEPAGTRIMLGGGLLLLLAVGLTVAGVSGLINGAGFGPFAILAGLAGLLGGLGFVRLTGGYAVATTTSRIVVDTGAGTIIFSQVNRLARERAQHLPIAAVRAVQLRRRNLLTSGFMSYSHPIVILNLDVAGSPWIVDSSRNLADVAPLAADLAALLGLPSPQEEARP